MFDLDEQETEIECPRCRFLSDVTLKQVRLRDAVICRGCKITIQLDDHMNRVRSAERSIKRAMRRLEKSIGSVSQTIKIEF